MNAVALLVLALGVCSLTSESPIRTRCFCTVQASDSAKWLAFQREQFHRVAAVQLVRVPSVSDRADGTTIASATLLRSWKGPTDGVVQLAIHVPMPADPLFPGTIRTSSCDLYLRPGDEYLVFAEMLPDGLLRARHCSGSVPRALAARIIAERDATAAHEPR